MRRWLAGYRGSRESDVQGVSQRAQGGFLDRFAEGRMGVDGAGDVFQAGAHLGVMPR